MSAEQDHGERSPLPSIVLTIPIFSQIFSQIDNLFGQEQTEPTPLRIPSNEVLSMNDQDVKNKYQLVADFMSRNGFQIEHFHAKDGKAILTAKAPTEYLKNRAWDEIKKVDSSFADLQHNITVGTETTYVVKSGDNLSNISKTFYGDANKYSQITKANKLDDPDKIKAGQKLIIPAA